MHKKKSTDEIFLEQHAPSKLKMLILGAWWKLGISKILKRNRIRVIENALGLDLFQGPPLVICELGCGSGRDFIKHLAGTHHTLVGVDVLDTGLRQDNFTMCVTDGAKIPFKDKHFDLIVSFGVLEHIEPIEHLCAVITECERVAQRYAMLVPCISTFLEPHTMQFRWQLGPVKKLDALNYLSDMAWLKFEGFKGATSKRFHYLAGAVTGLVIYR
jgi:ubiquinone/menaquinone biosynthesis C-methylase UbiE